MSTKEGDEREHFTSETAETSSRTALWTRRRWSHGSHGDALNAMLYPPSYNLFWMVRAVLRGCIKPPFGLSGLLALAVCQRLFTRLQAVGNLTPRLSHHPAAAAARTG